MILELVSRNDPILKEELSLFDFQNPPCDPIQLSKDLSETMLHHNGLGLAANQVGLRHRVFVIRSNPILACFNPRIVDLSTETETMEEGCLTFPDLILKIERPKAIRVRYTQPNGETQTVKFMGMTARAFQHELDHLNGILFTDKISKLKLEIAMKKARKK